MYKSSYATKLEFLFWLVFIKLRVKAKSKINFALSMTTKKYLLSILV